MNLRGNLARSCAAAVCALTIGAASAQQQLQVIVNGDPVAFHGAKPQTLNGRVLVPLRGVLEELGAFVNWDSAGQLVTAQKGDLDVELRIGDRIAKVNGQSVTMDVPAQIFRGTTLVPLRFMSEALGADVRYEPQQYAVVITTGISDTTPSNGNTPSVVSISSFDVNKSGWLKPGELVTFTLSGTPGGKASLQIPGVTNPITMVERSPGEYTANWTVPNVPGGMAIHDASAVARLQVGRTERLIQAGNTFSVDTQAPVIRSMIPEPDSRIGQGRPGISAVFDDQTGSGILPDTVRVMLDGDDVTSNATVTANFVSYKPEENLTSGTHKVSITGQDEAGNKVAKVWNFTVGAGDLVTSFHVTGADNPQPGDVIRVELIAQAGGKAKFSIGDRIKNKTMTEKTPGHYIGEYTVKKRDALVGEQVVAKFTSRDGQTYTVQSDEDTVVSGALERPVITSPKSGKSVDSPLVISGTAAPNARVHIKLDYTSTVAGALRLNGTVADLMVTADENGKFETNPIALNTLFGGSNVEYTILAEVIGEKGEKSSQTKLTVKD